MSDESVHPPENGEERENKHDDGSDFFSHSGENARLLPQPRILY